MLAPLTSKTQADRASQPNLMGRRSVQFPPPGNSLFLSAWTDAVSARRIYFNNLKIFVTRCSTGSIKCDVAPKRSKASALFLILISNYLCAPMWLACGQHAAMGRFRLLFGPCGLCATVRRGAFGLLVSSR